jgi:hypothetical protein
MIKTCEVPQNNKFNVKMEFLPFGSLIKVRKGELWVKDVG